ncbi:hypothetical protein EV186_103868 [Labedaea rhizosphaerae]|uniref:Uncharacterized protein n=1 Tax=Labedaea rhizosphaerae TaxID=598644 RepID=A0A4R6SCT3_LABRH|nr:hypothetical protein EV186_103868 [Labedaea rhizosphaerae]
MLYQLSYRHRRTGFEPVTLRLGNRQTPARIPNYQKRNPLQPAHQRI